MDSAVLWMNRDIRKPRVLPQPLRRKGIREFWFEIDPAAGCFEIDFTERPASLYFIDQRFYRGVCLKGFFQIEEFSDINRPDSLQENQETGVQAKLILSLQLRADGITVIFNLLISLLIRKRYPEYFF